jgi:cytochrome c556
MRLKPVRTKLGLSSAVLLACAAAGVTLSLLAAEKAPESYAKLMKEAGATAGSLRKDSTAKDYSGVSSDAEKFHSIYAEAKTFWDARHDETASSALSAGAKAAEELQAGAQSKNDESIASASQALMKTCATCHGAHREKVGDGFEIK